MPSGQCSGATSGISSRHMEMTKPHVSPSAVSTVELPGASPGNAASGADSRRGGEHDQP